MQKRDASCSNCGAIVPSYDTVQCGSIEMGYKQLCNQCFNQQVAKMDGLDAFQHANFPPLASPIVPAKSTSLTFVPACLAPVSPLMRSNSETGQPEGYRFQIIGFPVLADFDQVKSHSSWLRTNRCTTHARSRTCRISRRHSAVIARPAQGRSSNDCGSRDVIPADHCPREITSSPHRLAQPAPTRLL